MSTEFFGKTIFITGATGCVGKALSKTLLKEGWTIKALARSPEEAAWLTRGGADAVQGDITNADSLQQAMQGADFIFHLYGSNDSHASPAANQPPPSLCAKAAAEAALRVGVERFILLSDSIVYGYDRGKDTSEVAPLSRSGDPVIAERVRAEKAVRKAAERGLPAVILQPTTVYGPLAEAWTLHLLRLIESGELACPHQGQGLLQPIHIHDVVEGILTAALVGKPGEAYLLPGPDVLTCKQFCDSLAQMLGKQEFAQANSGGLFGALAGNKPALEPWQARSLSMKATYNGGKAYFDMGYLPRYTLDAGMRHTQELLQKAPI